MNQRRSLLALVACFVASVACSSAPSNGSSGSSDLHFHAQEDAIPGFSGDTGLQPTGQPVQVELTLSAAGNLTIDAHAAASGSLSSPTVNATPGSGSLALDGHIRFAGRVKSTLTGIPQYDGPIPNMDSLDVAFGGTTPFDPFLLGGGKANVTAHIPDTQLPPIPLGSVPGDLVITVTSASFVSVDFTGLCAAATGAPSPQAQYTGQTTTSGTLVLKVSIVVHVPVVGDETFDAPQPITVPIGPIDGGVDLGTLPITAVGDAPNPAGAAATSGTCAPPPDGGAPPPQDDGGADAGADDASTGTDAAPSAVCGDGVCTGPNPENAQTCPADCGALVFNQTDARRVTSTGDWRSGELKAECGMTQPMVGLSVGNNQTAQYASAHAALCGYDDPKWTHGGCYALDFGAGDARNDTSSGDWAPADYKGECGYGDYVAGVARDSWGRANGILCCQGAGIGKNSCQPREMWGADARESTMTGDWDPNHFKGECDAGRYVAGVGSTTGGGTDAILCCSP